LFICAALHEYGCRLCGEVVRQSAQLVATRSDLHALVLNYAKSLKSDPYGVTVIKAFKSME
jgi:hypothetical protein